MVPGDWGAEGPNFGTEWHKNEAIYWGCRLGVTSETVASWQKASEELGMAQEISLARIQGRDLVVIEEVAGDAHCFDLTVLAKVNEAWELVWRLPIARNSMDYCTEACPAVKAKISANILTIESPQSSDPNEDTTFTCKHVTWRKRNFRWTGTTFALQPR